MDAAKDDIPTLLLDHAHCEKKAASTAINLLFRYPEHPALVKTLSPLAREELEHFELVVRVLESRGHTFGPLVPSPYASKLMRSVRKGEPQRMLDTLLCCSLIEARSCERMKLLSEHLDDPELAAFYRELLASEARHHHVYVDLAIGLAGREVVKARLVELAQHEAAVLSVQDDVFRMHSAASA